MVNVIASVNPQALGRVAVLMGGESAEREISLRSGAGVLDALKRSGVNAFAFDPSERPLDALVAEGVDRVMIALHGRYGEDGTVQGALELLKIPYTGSGVMASSVAMNKVMTKRIWSTLNLPTPAFMMLQPGFDPHEVIRQVGLPMAVKPVSEGSSLGFTKVTQIDQLQAAFDLAHRLDHQVIAESFVSGREFTCALLQDGQGHVQALPVIEIQAPEGQYDYQNKYFGNATRYACPADIPADIETLMRSLSVKAFEGLECSGWARVDLMWNEKDSPTLLEINTSPGMTDHSLVPMAAREAGLSYEQLVMQIAASASLKIASGVAQ